MRFLTQALTAAAAVGVVAGGGAAYTASNSNGVGGNFVNTALGQGATVTSGYTVTNVAYALGTSAANADRITSISFTLAGAVTPTSVKIRIRSTDTYNVLCVGTTTITCDPTPAGDTQGATNTAGSGIAISAVTLLDILATSF